MLAASATVGRPLRRMLTALSGRTLEVIRPPDEPSPVADPSAELSGAVDGREAAAHDGTRGTPPAKGQRAIGLATGISVDVITYDLGDEISALHAVLNERPTSAPSSAPSPALLFTRPGLGLASEIAFLRQCELDAAPLDALLIQHYSSARPAEAGGARVGSAASSGGTAGDGGGSGDAGSGGEAQRRLLVATPSGARGLDLHDVGLVIVSGVPPSADAFVHLAGRTARMGTQGRVVVLATREEADMRLSTLGSQLGVDFGASRRHVASSEGSEAAARWAEMLRVHRKKAESKGTAAPPKAAHKRSRKRS